MLTDVAHPSLNSRDFVVIVSKTGLTLTGGRLEMAYKQHIFLPKPLITTKQLFQSQVHVHQVETEHHGNLVYDDHFHVTKCGFHNFLRSFR